MLDVAALGELLIDFTDRGLSDAGMRLFEQNPGGAPANMLAAAARLGERTAFIGKVGDDMHGRFLRDTLTAAGIKKAEAYFKVENLAAAEKDNILTSADCNTDTLKEFCGNFGLCNNRNSVTAVNNKITVRNEHLIPSLNRTDSHLTSEVVNSAQSSSDN